MRSRSRVENGWIWLERIHEEAHLGWDDPLVNEMLAQAFHDLNLLLGTQSGDRLLNHPANAGLVNSDETLVVHESKEAHDELAVHTIRDATMARN